jgi:hypothetical protein
MALSVVFSRPMPITTYNIDRKTFSLIGVAVRRFRQGKVLSQYAKLDSQSDSISSALSLKFIASSLSLSRSNCHGRAKYTVYNEQILIVHIGRQSLFVSL